MAFHFYWLNARALSFSHVTPADSDFSVPPRFKGSGFIRENPRNPG